MDRNPNDDIAHLLYQPLRGGGPNDPDQEIRLLAITSAPEDPELHCEVRPMRLADAAAQGFFALSYVWGDAKVTEPFWVNDVEFQATVNLAAALRQFSCTHRYAVDALWVDAVCINQSDRAERAAQVQLMGAIYSSAAEVLCWLGVGDQQSTAALRLITSLAQDVDMATHSGVGAQSLEFLSHTYYPQAIEAMGAACFMDADLFRANTYWNRVWTLQEIVLAGSCRLICGACSCLLEQIEGVIDWLHRGPLSAALEEHETLSQPPVPVTAEMWAFLQHLRRCSETTNSIMSVSAMRYHYARGAPDAVTTLLTLATSRRCYNLRDKLYGLAGLVDVGVQVDYDIDVADLYTGFAGRLTAQADDLKFILACVRAGDTDKRLVMGLPSWVPEWTKLSSMCDGLFHANKDCPAAARQVTYDGSRRLQVKGALIDKVDKVMTMPGWIEHMERIRLVVQFFLQQDSATILRETLTKAPVNDISKLETTRLEAVLRLLSNKHGQLVRPSSPVSANRSLLTKPLSVLIQSLLEDPLLPDDLRPSWPETKNSSSSGAMLQRVLDTTRLHNLDYRALSQEAQAMYDDQDLFDIIRLNPLLRGAVPFVTVTGYVGFAEEGIRVGDSICVLGSCSVPLVLRQCLGQSYCFHSLAHVAGLMSGEVWTGLKKDIHSFDVA